MVRVQPLQIVFLKKPAGSVQKYKASSSKAQKLPTVKMHVLQNHELRVRYP